MSTTSRAVRGSLGILQIRRLENADDTGIYALVRRFCQTVITSVCFRARLGCLEAPDAKDGGRSGRERQQQCHAVQ
jgi:hypothetical protein